MPHPVMRRAEEEATMTLSTKVSASVSMNPLRGIEDAIE